MELYQMTTDNYYSVIADMQIQFAHLEKHIDELEADIDFLANERAKQEETINLLNKTLSEKNKELDAIKNDNTNIRDYLAYIDERMSKLEVNMQNGD